jgi:hypothetical protein
MQDLLLVANDADNSDRYRLEYYRHYGGNIADRIVSRAVQLSVGPTNFYEFKELLRAADSDLYPSSQSHQSDWIFEPFTNRYIDSSLDAYCDAYGGYYCHTDL